MYGSSIRRARLAVGMTQAQLAAVSGVDQPNISAIESDRRQPTLDSLQRLLAGCGYALLAVGSGGRIALPHPDELHDLVTPTLPGARPASPEEANQVLMAALSVAEATVQAKAT